MGGLLLDAVFIRECEPGYRIAAVIYIYEAESEGQTSGLY
jgi:hypothetical protein